MTAFFDREDGFLSFAKVLTKNYISIAEVDLNTGDAIVLKSEEDRELEGRKLSWSALLERYSQRRMYPEDHPILSSMSYDCLKEFLERGQDDPVFEVRCITTETSYIWVEIKFSILSLSQKKLLVTTQSIDRQRMMENIIEQFVFQNFDYFILLNAKTNSYTMFSGDQNGSPLPPVRGDDYTAEMERYNARYLIPEEYEQVTANMQIDHILKMLERNSAYSFVAKGITEDGRPRYSRVQYRYYDQAAGLILLTRTNITELFIEEQEKNQRLTAALYDAQHDALTGLLNQKGTESYMSDSLEQLGEEQAAFLFIDVDNFKMVNDTLGHQEGDQLLRFLGHAIQKIAGQTGVAGRIGGDEFLLFLPEFSSIEKIIDYTQQVCNIFDSYTRKSYKELPISCSVGVSIYPKDGTDYECLLRKADQALYTSKRYGKNRCYFYSEEMPSVKRKQE